MSIRVAIVGAGMSGMSCAHLLSEQGPKGMFNVTFFEKSRGAGGRMSTRRVPDTKTSRGMETLSFDHGAQYFTVRASEFEERVKTWDGTTAKVWDAKIVSIENGKTEAKEGGPKRYVGVQGMNSVGKKFAEGLDIKLNTRVTKISHTTNQKQWSLLTESGETFEPFDWVILYAPAPQTADLLTDVDAEMEKKARGVVFHPCYAGMYSFEKPLGLEYDGAFINKDSTLSWVAKNSSKPDRPDVETWVLHGNPDFSRKHLEEAPEQVEPLLLEAFAKATGAKLPEAEGIIYRAAFKWRFSQPEPLSDPFLLNTQSGIGACGDWCGGSKVEGAFMSGHNLGRAILQHHVAESTLRSNV